MTHTATTPAASNNVDGYSVGQTLTVTCEAPAHGGAFVARTEQGVIFVRHGIVGEQAEVRITAISTSAASTSQMLSPYPYPPWHAAPTPGSRRMRSQPTRNAPPQPAYPNYSAAWNMVHQPG